MHCLISGEARREPTGKVRAADTPPRELFSLTHVILLIPEQILSTIYGKSAILQCRWPVGADRDSSPGSLVGALSSIFDPVFGVRTLQSFSLQTSAPVGSFSLECPSEPLFTSTWLTRTFPFRYFLQNVFLGFFRLAKRTVCVYLCVYYCPQQEDYRFFFLIFKRFCYIFNPSGIHFNFGVGKKSNIIFLIANCPHTIITYQLIYS